MTDSSTHSGETGEIERNLRFVYKDVLEGDIPQRFQDLIRKLKKADESATGEDSA